jgi:hypothetical protein
VLRALLDYENVRPGPGGRRGPTVEWTRAMRSDCRFCIANYDGEWWDTFELTYPGEYPGSGAVVKYHLKRLLRRWEYEVGGKFERVWRLAFQKRGGPHFHGIVGEGEPGALYEWLGRNGKKECGLWLWRTWSEIVGSSARTYLQPVRSRGRVSAYVSGYVAKKDEQAEVPDDFREVGRLWGRSYGVTATAEELAVVDGSIARGLRRTCRRVYDRRGRGGCRLYGSERRVCSGWGLSDIGGRLLRAAGVNVA